MNKNYVAPQITEIEIILEDTFLNSSIGTNSTLDFESVEAYDHSTYL